MENSLSHTDEQYISWTKQTIKNYMYFATLTVTPVGLVFNTLMIIVFARKKFQKKTMGFYYIVSFIFFQIL